MIALFYEALKNTLSTAGNTSNIAWQYDYKQYLGNKPNVPNYPALAGYIGLPNEFNVMDSDAGAYAYELTPVEITMVQHTVLDNDSRILDANMAHLLTCAKVREVLDKRVLLLSDVPSLNIVPNSLQDDVLSSTFQFRRFKAESALGPQIMTKLVFDVQIMDYTLPGKLLTAMVNGITIDGEIIN